MKKPKPPKKTAECKTACDVRTKHAKAYNKKHKAKIDLISQDMDPTANDDFS